MASVPLSDRATTLQDAARSRLWPLPLLMVLVGVVVGYWLPRLDEVLTQRLPLGTQELIFSGGPDAARAVLAAIAGSLVTVTSLTFSLTIVTLQLASSQYTPRLLRTFISDVFTQVTLGLFLGTFAFALVVLRTVRSAEEGDAFVPRLSVTVAVILVVVACLQLVLFIAHLVGQIRAETILDRVRAETRETIGRELALLDEAEADPLLRAPDDAVPLLAPASGVITYVNLAVLRDAAVEAGACLEVQRVPGEPVVAGTPLGVAWPVDDVPAYSLDVDALRAAVAEAVTVGPERTTSQDVAYGLRQLVDIAAKALSPGTNDPTTAVHALNQVSALLCDLCDHDLGPEVAADEAGRARAARRRPSFASLLDLACGQVRRYGADETAVVSRHLQMLTEVAWRARTADQRDAVRTELARLDAAWPEKISDEVDAAALRAASRRVTAALGHRWETTVL